MRENLFYVQTPPEISANPLKNVLYIEGIPCMYIVIFHCSPGKKNGSDPHFFGLATPLSGPISSATSERSFSTLKWTKTWIRSTQGELRLSALASMQIEKEVLSKITTEQILGQFISKTERRMMFKWHLLILIGSISDFQLRKLKGVSCL